MRQGQGRIQGKANLAYAAIHPFPLPGWNPPQLIRAIGPSLQVIMKPDGADYVDIERGGKVTNRHLEGPNVLIGASQGLSDPVAVETEQKPLIDAARGALLLAGPPVGPILLPPVWEGVLKKDRPETIVFEVHRPEGKIGISAPRH